MSEYDLFVDDAVTWAKSYKGSPFHAFFCDPPYHLDTITKRFGKKDSAPAKYGQDGLFGRISSGFMGEEWDTDIAFYPETWKAFYDLLYPGAFGLSYAGSRTGHRIACAIEDAGFIIHPILGWVHPAGNPKPTRIDRRVENGEIWEGHRYGLQAMRPVLEPIILFQKPYEGRPVDYIDWIGAGALNIDGTRISAGPGDGVNHPGGRWPANFLLVHHPECVCVGQRETDPYTINRFTDGMKPFGGGAGHAYETIQVTGGVEDIWDCVEECPVYQLSKPPEGGKPVKNFYNVNWLYETLEYESPVFCFSKAPRRERKAGRDEYFKHPTYKPIDLNKYLATLLLPPDNYKPRRLLIPFAGVGSEGIGAMLAGWDQIVMVELLQKYAIVAKQRMDWWIERVDGVGSVDPQVLLKGVK